MPVHLHTQDRIATITIDRPEKLNALTLEMIDELESHIVGLERDRNPRVVLITGAGDRSFCVGADINAWSSLDAVDMWKDWIREGHRVFGRIASLRIPTIAVLNGYTFGGGLELALAADLRVAADDIQVALPEVKLGIVPGWGGTHRLPALIGPARAKHMVLAGIRIDASRALDWGLVNEIAPKASLMNRALEIAESIAENAPLAVQMAKQLIDGGATDKSGYYLEALASGFARFTEDAHEGIAAFKEKRQAMFKGR